MFCREQAARYVSIQTAVEELGAQIVAIGNGSVDMAQAFADQFGIHYRLLTDPSLQTYKRAGLKRSFGLGPKTLGKAARAMMAGHRQGKTQGDVWQQGGTIIVDTNGEVLLHHANTEAGDHLPLDEVLGCLRTAMR